MPGVRRRSTPALCQGFRMSRNHPKNVVHRIQRAMYGLSDSGRLWNRHLDANVQERQYKPSTVKRCVYVRSNDNGTVENNLSIYIDDIS
eukprot:scaffold485509_cov18-Prasinocladus_malaysianus.AAC.1